MLRKYFRSYQEQQTGVLFQQAKRRFHYEPDSQKCPNISLPKGKKLSTLKHDYSTVQQDKTDSNEINQSSWLAKLVNGIEDKNCEEEKVDKANEQHLHQKMQSSCYGQSEATTKALLEKSNGDIHAAPPHTRASSVQNIIVSRKNSNVSRRKTKAHNQTQQMNEAVDKIKLMSNQKSQNDIRNAPMKQYNRVNKEEKHDKQNYTISSTKIGTKRNTRKSYQTNCPTFIDEQSEPKENSKLACKQDKSIAKSSKAISKQKNRDAGTQTKRSNIDKSKKDIDAQTKEIYIVHEARQSSLSELQQIQCVTIKHSDHETCKDEENQFFDLNVSDHFADELFKEPSLVKKMDSQKIGSIKANNVRGKDSSADKTSAQLVGSAAKSKETIQDSNKQNQLQENVPQLGKMIEISKVVERDRKADHLKEAMLHIRQKYTQNIRFKYLEGLSEERLNPAQKLANSAQLKVEIPSKETRKPLKDSFHRTKQVNIFSQDNLTKLFYKLSQNQPFLNQQNLHITSLHGNQSYVAGIIINKVKYFGEVYDRDKFVAEVSEMAAQFDQKKYTRDQKDPLVERIDRGSPLQKEEKDINREVYLEWPSETLDNTFGADPKKERVIQPRKLEQTVQRKCLEQKSSKPSSQWSRFVEAQRQSDSVIEKLNSKLQRYISSHQLSKNESEANIDFEHSGSTQPLQHSSLLQLDFQQLRKHSQSMLSSFH